MEEAGFRTCVSVPDGAPPKVSSKELPPEENVCVSFNILSILARILLLSLQFLFLFSSNYCCFS